MNEQKARLLTILSAILLVLVAVLVLAEPPKDDEETTETWDPAFGDEVDVETVTAVELNGPSGSLRLERTDGRWRITAPEALAADDRKASDLVRAVAELEVGPILDLGTGGDLAGFGLDAPIGVRLERSGGASPLSVRIGKDAPVGMRTYVQVGEETAVRASRSRLRRAVGSGLGDLRDHAVILFDRSEVTRIRIDDVELHHDDLGWWVAAAAAEGTAVHADGVLRGDDDRVRSFLQDVLDIRADSFPAADTWVGREPLEVHAVDLWTGDASAPQVVTVTRWTPDEWSVAGPAQPNPVRTSVAPLPGLQTHVDGWTATWLLPVRDSQLSAVRVRTPRLSFEALRREGVWDPAAGATVVDAIRNARVDRSRRVEVARDAPVVGNIEIEEDGHRIQRLLLFAALPSGDAPARDREGGPTFLLAASQLRDLEDAAALATGPAPATGPAATGASTRGP